jgi:acyl-coenzyme A thioesterase PaaI-like protein
VSLEISKDQTFADDHYCLCCGDQNPLGFKMKFRFEGEKLLSEAVVPKEYQGFSHVVHGGILGTLLDELMVNCYWLKGIKAVTVEYQVRLKTPCPTGARIFLSAWSLGEKHHLHYVATEARLEDGTVVAEATAKCMKIK